MAVNTDDDLEGNWVGSPYSAGHFQPTYLDQSFTRLFWSLCSPELLGLSGEEERQGSCSFEAHIAGGETK